MKKRHRKESFSDRFWLDKDGKLTVWQKPNKYLVIWAISVLIQIVLGGSNKLVEPARIIGTLSLVIWAILEAVRGDSYFRRIVGYCVLILLAFVYII